MSFDASAPDPARTEEAAHLDQTLSALHAAIAEAERRLQDLERDIAEQKSYLWENRDEMDHIEKIAARDQIQQYVSMGDALLALKTRLAKLQASPYFGRFDFVRDGAAAAERVYLGIHHFQDEHQRERRIYDWRAPIAGVFYDHELGPARYAAPHGDVQGNVTLKRQFRIRDGRIELLLDTAVNVVDDVLQAALGGASDEGMKQIVATLQRDQNAIIRNDEASVLIIQGVAGSGKTSIALHRIAYLLYRFKDTLRSEDILIVSPNRVFADYIANVLPELGEESVDELQMEDLAETLLEGALRFQTFFEQTAELLARDDTALRARIGFKSGAGLLKQLDTYAAHVEKSRFVGEDLWLARRLVPGWLFDEIFATHRAMETKDRLKQVAVQVEQKIGIEYHYDLTPDDRRELRASIKRMHRPTSLRECYRQFWTWLKRPELFKLAKGGRLEYADVFPLIYLKLQLERSASPYRAVKHLLVDEMQDYTAVQYAVLAKLFSCNKTILGDARQSINPYSASTLDDIRGVFPAARSVLLNKSYRSTYEIAQFAQRISFNPDLEALRRHGPQPEVLAFKSRQAEARYLTERAQALAASAHNTLAVLCRCQKHAEQVAAALTEQGIQPMLLHARSGAFRAGVIVSTAHMAKGLEFDQVIVADVNDKRYASAMDRNLLYVACTRAMHQLTVTHVGPVAGVLRAGLEGDAPQAG